MNAAQRSLVLVNVRYKCRFGKLQIRPRVIGDNDDFGKTFKPYQLGIDATYITHITVDPKTDTLLAVAVSYEKGRMGRH